MLKFADALTRHPVRTLIAILLVYSLLILPTARRHGISWDEQTDIAIARSYLAGKDGWYVGSPSDPSQTRLPMAAVALVYALLGRNTLLIGRLVSCLVGALTLIGVYVYGASAFDRRVGLIAAGILSTSPFFLSFARIAFTETDIYVACAFAWLLVCATRLERQWSAGWAALTGLAMGLALSSKFTAITVLPALVLYLALARRRNAELRTRTGLPIAASMAFLSTAVLYICVWSALVAKVNDPRVLLRGPFALALGCWAVMLLWAAYARKRSLDPAAAALLVLALALLTFVIVPPEHTTNPAILQSIARRFTNEMRHDLDFVGEAVALHVLSVFFKSSPGMGLALIGGALVALWQWPRDRAVRLPLLLLVSYAGGLAALPIAQTFYSIPLLPMLAVLVARAWVQLLDGRKWLAWPVAVIVLVWLLVDLALCTPDYNLNGYQYLGARPLAGRSSIGYRNVVQTTSDGVEQCVIWLNEHAQPGDRVVLYVNPWHIVQATRDPRSGVRFVKGENRSLNSRPEWVVTHINNELWQGFGLDQPQGNVFRPPYDETLLHENYQQVAVVRRAFGIEMGAVWQRK